MAPPQQRRRLPRQRWRRSRLSRPAHVSILYPPPLHTSVALLPVPHLEPAALSCLSAHLLSLRFLAAAEVGWDGSVEELQALVASLELAVAFARALTACMPTITQVRGGALRTNQPTASATLHAVSCCRPAGRPAGHLSDRGPINHA